jgi:adenylate kinase
MLKEKICSIKNRPLFKDCIEFKKEELNGYNIDSQTIIGVKNGFPLITIRKMQITKFYKSKVAYSKCMENCGYKEKIYKLDNEFRKYSKHPHNCDSNSHKKTNINKISKSQRKMIIDTARNLTTTSKFILSKPSVVHRLINQKQYIFFFC